MVVIREGGAGGRLACRNSPRALIRCRRKTHDRRRTVTWRVAMHHFRGKLLQGDRPRLDPANVYVQYGAADGDRGQGWYGYLLVASEADVEPGGVYTLT